MSLLNDRNKIVLTDAERTEVARQYRMFCNDVHVYGSSIPSANDCRRYRHHSDPERGVFKCRIDGIRSPYFAYKISYMHVKGYKVKPTRRLYGISHICGKTACINVDHMIIEPSSINNKRRICHDWISNLLTKINNKKHIKNLQEGQITVDIINVAYKEYYTHYTDDDLHKCIHTENPCFINRIKQ